MKQLLSLALGMALLAVSGPSRAQFGGDGTDPCSDDCPLVWSHALEDSNVECVDELPTTCEEFLTYASAEGLVAQNACTGQVMDLAQRKRIPRREVEYWLASIIDYDPN